MSQTLTITLPDAVFQKLTRVAQLTYQTIDEVVASTVETSLPGATDLPDGLAAELAAMYLYSDDALWAAVQPSLSPYELRRMEQLGDLVDERELTPREEAEQMDLLSAYDRSVLRRAQALALLKQRGHDLRSILSSRWLSTDGLTETGRATVETLRLNRPQAVDPRRLWVSVG
ncbi:MAG TPA: hypothetical protein PL105_21375 [Caldilineaceae bacterium]|nr:hypothetical protein [Caldilineaceae bacterium]